MKRTMQRRKWILRRELLAEPDACGWRLGSNSRQPGTLGANTTGEHQGPAGVWSMARVDSTAAKVGKVSWVASALPHSEGAAYKQQGCEVAACPRDWRMGSSKAVRERDSITRTGAEDPWGREAWPLAQRPVEARARLDAEPVGRAVVEAGEGQHKLARDARMPGAGLTARRDRKVLSEMLALEPYRGKPAVRNLRGDDGNVGIIRSPVRAIVLLDNSKFETNLRGNSKSEIRNSKQIRRDKFE